MFAPIFGSWLASHMRGPPTDDPYFGQEKAVLMDKLHMPVRESLMRQGNDRVHRLMELGKGGSRNAHNT